MSARRIWSLVKESVSAWIADYAPSMGAALAYYTLFSIAPLLLIVIAIAGLVFGAEAAQNAVVAQLDGLIGHEGAVAIQGLLRSASEPTRGMVATIVGAVTLVIGATTVFAELQSDLDRVWEVPAAKKDSRHLGITAAAAAFVRDGARAGPADARVARAERCGRGARKVVGQLVRGLGGCLAGRQLCGFVRDRDRAVRAIFKICRASTSPGATSGSERW